ncbi:NADPH:quinone reductase [Virgisporangium aliadipatigenens]|uniref:NADPH:quinone reductase n=1 Tax=Virgisporangium aliadipatigenens TaxID=741659 RepID=A0A8J3YM82_9ACTN|nr:medium chain dehydrogenase/reductase family protein [Virgisporangium aliadipatigenens]GIJ46683.1 NADPH:quinone reductase [Virgisporangium aliadipatigenens]
MNRIEIVLPGVVEPEGLQVREVELPVPADGQALVRMEATGLSFAEQQMRLGRYYDQPAFPFVPGYDLVGIVEAVGPGTDHGLVGQRVAALTKIGGWASHVVLDAADLVPVPTELDPVEAETVVVNGITAWQMLHRTARVRAGATILVHGANGGVGSTLVQLARIAGITVIGTASPRHHDRLRELGAIPVDYNGDVPAQVRRLAPGGVDAVFDHLGPDSMSESWRLLAPGGVMVGYGTATSKNDTGNKNAAFLRMMPKIWTWNALPNGKRAYFYNLWAGRALAKSKHRALVREDLTQVLRAMADKRITAQVAARIPLARVAEAMRLAESRTVAGKVVLVP